MSLRYTKNLTRSIPVAIITSIIAFILSYLVLPTNVGYVFWALVLSAGVSYYVMNTSEEGNRFLVSFSFLVISGLLIGSLFLSPVVFTRIDNANYFDDQLIYVENELPFQTRINGSELRVVDRELAISIMDKTNPFGSNRAITSIHLGSYQGNIYWIGAAIFDGIILNNQNNRIVGFILVDITDPTEEPIVLHDQDFLMNNNLIFNRDSGRIVWNTDINYLTSDNAYFSYNDDVDRMELIVPYSIQDAAFLGDSNGGFVTSDMNLDGGVMIFGPEGNLIDDYSGDERQNLPDHAKIQVYSETWLEDQISWWGRSLVADNDVRWSTALPWVRSERLLGIDDDIRVVINPDNFESVQYVLLDSTDSTNQILRGAIKANTSGLFYYNFEEFQFIDTNSAHSFIGETITNIRQTSTHGYTALLPILYPVRENVSSLRDYAYVMPLQLGESRFGGIAITNPADKTGTQSIVEFVESEERANVAETVAKALDDYIALIEDGNQTNIPNDQTRGNFTVSDVRSYQEDGSTVYAMEGNFTEEIDNLGIDGEVRILFTQDFITNEEHWLDVVFTNPGDVLNLLIEESRGLYYAVEVTVVSRA